MESLSLISAYSAVRSEGQHVPEHACLTHSAFCACALNSVISLDQRYGRIFGSPGDL